MTVIPPLTSCVSLPSERSVPFFQDTILLPVLLPCSLSTPSDLSLILLCVSEHVVDCDASIPVYGIPSIQGVSFMGVSSYEVLPEMLSEGFWGMVGSSFLSFVLYGDVESGFLFQGSVSPFLVMDGFGFQVEEHALYSSEMTPLNNFCPLFENVFGIDLVLG